jgi:hypothetical protein
VAELLDALESAQAELAAVRGGAVLESLKVEEFVEICQEHGTDVSRCKAITELFRSRLRSAPEGTVLVDAGELEALNRAVGHARQYIESDKQEKRAWLGWTLDEFDQAIEDLDSLRASQHPGQGGEDGADLATKEPPCPDAK